MYDIIIRCIFIFVFENYRILLFIECDEILVFESFWLKLFSEKLNIFKGIFYDISNLKIEFFLFIWRDGKIVLLMNRNGECFIKK